MYPSRLTAFLFALVLVLAGAAAAALPISDSDAVQKEMMAFRDAMQSAIRAKDAIKLKTMFADGFSHIDGGGALTDRDAHITELLIGEARLEDAGVAEWRLRVYGRDTAILTGRSTLATKAGSASNNVRWTQIFVREYGVWRIAGSQVTRLP